MSGTIKGGKKAAKTNKEKHGSDFYARIGRKGGKNSKTGGFASEKVGKDGLTGLQRAKIAGQKGGTKSRRGMSKEKIEQIRKEIEESATKLADVLKDYIETPKEV